ncbi:MAG: BON domain-containing protein [Betaproteobacteria bacterium]|nr:BON domain-containing protein [Betaproteobacteria bacterium]
MTGRFSGLSRLPFRARTIALLALAGMICSSLTACFPIAATGMVVGALSITDRRTTGAQLEDQQIELKAFGRLRDRFKGDSAVTASVTSFNRTALVTGYVPDQATKVEVDQIIKKIENVRVVVNELIVGVPASLTIYGKDVVLTTRVKTALIDTRDVNANVIKVVTESGAVYLMGLVTNREADRASDVASRVPGVSRVVRAFEIITEEQRNALDSAGKAGQPLPETRGTSPVPASPAASGGSGAQVTPVR